MDTTGAEAPVVVCAASNANASALIAPFEKGGQRSAQCVAGDLLLILLFEFKSNSKSPVRRCALARPLFKGGDRRSPETGLARMRAAVLLRTGA